MGGFEARSGCEDELVIVGSSSIHCAPEEEVESSTHTLSLQSIAEPRKLSMSLAFISKLCQSVETRERYSCSADVKLISGVRIKSSSIEWSNPVLTRKESQREWALVMVRKVSRPGTVTSTAGLWRSIATNSEMHCCVE